MYLHLLQHKEKQNQTHKMPKKYQGEAELSKKEKKLLREARREKDKKWAQAVIRAMNAKLLVPQGPPPKKQKKKAPLGDLVIPRK